MSEEEEFDYMSDDFLVDGTSQDIRPGLQNRMDRRQAELEKKKELNIKMNKQASNRQMKALQRENLRQGLEIPLDSSNKGFAMLQKMGFKPGTSLGKSGGGITEPIPVPVNRNFREGLGVKAALKEMRKEKAHTRKEAKQKAPSVEDFRSRVIEEANEREAGIDLHKSQNSCISLDSAQGLKHMTEISADRLVPARNIPQKGDDKEKAKIQAPKPKKDKPNYEVVVVPEGYPKLSFDQDLFNELREIIKAKIIEIEPGKEVIPQLADCYLYKDIEAGVFKCSNGSTKSWLYGIGMKEPLEAFFWPPKALAKAETTTEEEEEDEDDLLAVQDKLEMLTYYLRRTYFYCLWCGVKYNDEGDMQKECPGSTRNDH